jgi:hypothetical protein
MRFEWWSNCSVAVGIDSVAVWRIRVRKKEDFFKKSHRVWKGVHSRGSGVSAAVVGVAVERGE